MRMHDDARRLRNHVVRDSRYLNWRYVDSPREYRLLETEGGGFAVVGFTRKRGLRLALLMELVGARRGSPRRPASRRARRRLAGSAALLAVPSPVLPRSRLLGTGSSRRRTASTSWARGSPSRSTPARRRGRSRSVTRTSSESGRRVVFITQQVDPGHPALAATVPKIAALAALVDEVVVLADGAVEGVLPANCRVRTFRAGHKVGRGARFEAALARELRGLRGGAVVAHMCPIYAVLAAPLVRPLRVPLAPLVHPLARESPAARGRAGLDRGRVGRPPLVPARVGARCERSGTASTSPSSRARNRRAHDSLRLLALGRYSRAKGLERRAARGRLGRRRHRARRLRSCALGR